jgi:hypothetical protein
MHCWLVVLMRLSFVSDKFRFLLFYSYIPFNVQPVHIDLFNFFDPGLRQGIIADHDVKAEIISFPGPVAAKLQVFCIDAVCEAVGSCSGTIKSKTVFAFIQVMSDKRKMSPVDDLQESLVLSIVRRGGILSLDRRTGNQLPGTYEGVYRFAVSGLASRGRGWRLAGKKETKQEAADQYIFHELLFCEGKIKLYLL